jgi:hypothetical protein
LSDEEGSVKRVKAIWDFDDGMLNRSTFGAPGKYLGKEFGEESPKG